MMVVAAVDLKILADMFYFEIFRMRRMLKSGRMVVSFHIVGCRNIEDSLPKEMHQRLPKQTAVR